MVRFGPCKSSVPVRRFLFVRYHGRRCWFGSLHGVRVALALLVQLLVFAGLIIGATALYLAPLGSSAARNRGSLTDRHRRTAGSGDDTWRADGNFPQPFRRF